MERLERCFVEEEEEEREVWAGSDRFTIQSEIRSWPRGSLFEKINICVCVYIQRELRESIVEWRGVRKREECVFIFGVEKSGQKDSRNDKQQTGC